MNTPKLPNARRTTDAAAFAEAYCFISRELAKSALTVESAQSGKPLFICFTQPHSGTKEVRFAALLFSIVLADIFAIEYIWSSDWDTLILTNTIPSMTRTLSAEPTAAGASSLVQLNNGDVSFVSRIAKACFTCDFYLNRAALGALGRSECPNGPGTMFRKSALREVMIPGIWYHYPKISHHMVRIDTTDQHHEGT